MLSMYLISHSGIHFQSKGLSMGICLCLQDEEGYWTPNNLKKKATLIIWGRPQMMSNTALTETITWNAPGSRNPAYKYSWRLLEIKRQTAAVASATSFKSHVSCFLPTDGNSWLIRKSTSQAGRKGARRRDAWLARHSSTEHADLTEEGTQSSWLPFKLDLRVGSAQGISAKRDAAHTGTGAKDHRGITPKGEGLREPLVFVCVFYGCLCMVTGSFWYPRRPSIDIKLQVEEGISKNITLKCNCCVCVCVFVCAHAHVIVCEWNIYKEYLPGTSHAAKR